MKGGEEYGLYRRGLHDDRVGFASCKRVGNRESPTANLVVQGGISERVENTLTYPLS
jgi:hypothetical protein